MVRVLQRAVEVVGERDAEGFQLGGQTAVQLVGGALGVVDGRAVGVVEEVAGSDEAIAAVVAAGRGGSAVWRERGRGLTGRKQ